MAGFCEGSPSVWAPSSAHSPQAPPRQGVSVDCDLTPYTCAMFVPYPTRRPDSTGLRKMYLPVNNLLVLCRHSSEFIGRFHFSIIVKLYPYVKDIFSMYASSFYTFLTCQLLTTSRFVYLDLKYFYFKSPEIGLCAIYMCLYIIFGSS